MPASNHIPVLPTETLALLAPRPGAVAVDCTVGSGGHTLLLAEALGGESPESLVVGFDLDAANLEHVAPRVESTGVRFVGVHDNFARAAQRLREMGRVADVVLADLGFSSAQMDDPERGFSFRSDGPLDMRYDRSDQGPSRGQRGVPTAAELLATLPERELADLIFEFGEEPLARKIARKLAQSRERKPIQTTAELAGLVLEAYGGRARSSRMHPATRTFMALRIAVNGELAALRALLDSIATAVSAVGEDWLRAGTRVAIIAFHSLEDRMVKRAFAEWAVADRVTRLTKRPVTASLEEVRANPRARSAKLRAIEVGTDRT